MSDPERAIDSMAVCQWHYAPIVAPMARIAHVVCSEAAEESDGTTVHAFPVDLDVTVDVTIGSPGTDVLQEAILTHEVLFLL